ncbi:MAG: c-type cytochrome [Rhodospirillales bacterium]|nr:c-type cytochrome [Rhodospirillales bacterium]MDP6643477.1 c-type cytochrome [Rhodospirillales bacterium]MDP6842875.1 c-type cytochrome [Rhodospirillales bacterium]
MKTRFIILAALAACASLPLSYGNAGAEMASASLLANSCFSCHGTDGKSLGAMPSINGKEAKYIETTLMAFRSGKKPSTVMKRIAKGFDDNEIKALARHLSGIK